MRADTELAPGSCNFRAISSGEILVSSTSALTPRPGHPLTRAYLLGELPSASADFAILIASRIAS
jgi:hypothetical protein